ncbi:MAG: 16S rRNA (uracil(1498)-N(3))-methyltransferase [Calditrichaceae bacterium]|nr:16S rRNA (uracil(1498)-N(3))-methyltransferase [Calditrichaceae bacterium]MBN2710068.1 16S rRNA (uracil(1498)-N(3))-methyltransferase [Calditrichaceae bacterium]RQV94516.1 MAG: 16S rRNA (uracil(1498)-N(3))-methyltransferase [Calditrichota bacterium]
MELFYAEPENISKIKISLDPFEEKHIKTALRKKTGDIIYITDGGGRLIKTRIQKIKPATELEILDIQIIQSPIYKLALGIGFIKPARLEWILEKGTELGVCGFYLFRSQYANYYSDNEDKFRKTLRQAIKQSQRVFLPKLFLCGSLEDFLTGVQQYQSKYLAVNSEHPLLLSRLIADNSDGANSNPSLLVIGPEGGFDAHELEIFKQNNFIPVSLGESRLRAETAAISGITILKMFQDHLMEGKK